VGATRVIVMTKIISLLFLFLFSCGSEFIVTPTDVIEIEVEPVDTAPQTEVIIDYYVQPSKPESLDVLVVLDTSCSMFHDYEKVASGMDILRDDIETLTYDYQMAIINSSLSGEIYFVGPYDTETSSIDFLLGTSLLSNDDFEEGFRSHYQFASVSEEGLLFLRSGVPKLYIYISDEDEQSPIPVNIFKEWLDEYHDSVDYDVLTIAMVENSPHCSTGAMNIGHKFDQLSQYFNKRAIDFCGDWQLALADSSFLMSQITHLQLSKRPIEDSIVVYQNGTKEDNWYYLDSTNTVYLEFEIQEGAAIKIGYDSLVE
jgi:hypothetical protein|tara:strand:+ start:4700 stop:5641 length:942 start_codon:yes stop_codon:yes gene_type:complete